MAEQTSTSTADASAAFMTSFIEAMQAQRIHVGIGEPPVCVTCGSDWPCEGGRAQ